MAQVISVNVYEINGQGLKNIYRIGFGVGDVQFMRYLGNDARLNAYVQTLPNQFQYGVVETVAALVVLANA